LFKGSVFGGGDVKIKVTLNGAPYKCNFDQKDTRISLPIFTIHGNHDYPSSDFGRCSACDLLQASQYLNYFGKQLNLNKVVIRPLIITKEGCRVKLALYGLGYIKDAVLN